MGSEEKENRNINLGEICQRQRNMNPNNSLCLCYLPEWELVGRWQCFGTKLQFRPGVRWNGVRCSGCSIWNKYLISRRPTGGEGAIVATVGSSRNGEELDIGCGAGSAGGTQWATPGLGGPGCCQSRAISVGSVVQLSWSDCRWERNKDFREIKRSAQSGNVMEDKECL